MQQSSIPANRKEILQPGRNCWRIARAERFSMLVDAEAYFKAVREAIRNARRSIFILSWDIDSRTWLVPGGANDGFPEPLGEFLHEVVASRPGLHAYVLNWDFAMLYALEREWLPAYKLGWTTHQRLNFHMDGRHPVGASHHQKVVVIDDCLAFVGGLDLTRCRWDTPDHACGDPLRCDPEGKPHDPFHDVQAMVDGECAQALGELARERWRRATGHQALRHDPLPSDIWPAGVEADIAGIDVGISRTEPAYDGDPGVYEIRQLHLDAIACARERLFFENQYFTSDLICNALSARLADEDAPEIMIISPASQSGWLEQSTMGVLRARVHRRLQHADRHGRYRLYSPHIAALQDKCLNVHSKVLAADERLFSIGSANLSNRSMAFDTECNLVIEAGDNEEGRRIAGAIAAMRNRLLAEHLDCAPEQIDRSLAVDGSLHRTVDRLYKSERTLRRLDPETTPELDALIPDRAVFDPERPIDPDELVAQLVPKDARKPVPRRLVGIGALAIALALLAIAWRATPLREYVNLASMVNVAQHLDDLPFTPLAIMGCYVLAGMAMVPVMLLIAVTGIVFGPLAGAGYAIGGTMLSAVAAYGIGAWLGRETVRNLLGPRINRLSRRIAKRGILAMMVIRMLPVAPFTVVNVVAGASHIRFRDYLVGTLLGMTPGILLTVTFVHHLAEAIRNPTPGTVMVLVLVAALLIGSALGLQRLLDRKENPSTR
ncbi:Phosphatidylserine/phosphatidylglycerophosphate/cardiolipin synthase [Noviherbaspirillum humi]|uniref:Phosphatidylserine/phosphatidylglycerophosphate/cardiolipin synthase n=1 Tax=Noviherbaspirillum humi TaxID=1688639 RepID=A0A239HCF2_9BURK|nr:VTT domain-containing protein [Noviherbaspirillum humi]SNS79106.1 Phosphatidylserine/phosphatidylglycerophosphate/cardiolipin synthase [Noviherbaspirillum humi]